MELRVVAEQRCGAEDEVRCGPAMPQDPRDHLPDVRDGLTRVERLILHTLHQLQQERGGRNVPTAMLYGYVVEHVNLRPDEFQAILARLVGRGSP